MVEDRTAAYPLARLRELKYAEAAFLVASVAVWRDIDARDDRPGGYSANVLTKDTDLRVAERAAWNRYRKALDAARVRGVGNGP